jgi:hypothetical protein
MGLSKHPLPLVRGEIERDLRGKMGFLSRLFSSLSINQTRQVRLENPVELESEAGSFIFEVDDVDHDELGKCRIGDWVGLWIPKGVLDIVYVYRRGSIGGTGKIGYVPQIYTHTIAKHLDQGLKYETEIVKLDDYQMICRIKCRLISKEESEAKQKADLENSAASLRNELQKKYSPKLLSFQINIQLPKNHSLCEGQSIFIKKRPIEYYLQNALELFIEFVDITGVVVAKKSYDTKIIRTLLRAYYSNIKITMQITKIDKPSESMLKYIDSVEAQVQVNYN